MSGKKFEDKTDEEKYFYLALGLRLAQHRQRLGLSQKDVAREIGVTFQQVQKYESAENRIPIYLLHKMATIYGVSFADVISGDSKYILARHAQLKKLIYGITSDITKLSRALGIKKTSHDERTFTNR